MSSKLLLRNKNLLIVFVVLYSLTIGFKEVFRLIDDDNIDITFYLFYIILSIVTILFSMNLMKQYMIIYVLSTLLYVILFLSSFTTMDISYGIQKSFLGILLPLFVFSIFIRFKWTRELILSCFCVTIVGISIVAILYKLTHGFFIRSVPFGVLGSIPFGWVNGFGFVLVGMKLQKKMSDYLLLIFFILMVIWTGSKGPLLALSIIVMFNFNKILGKKFSTKLITAFVLCFVIFFIYQFADDIRSVRSFVALFEDPEGYVEGAGSGSIGSRSSYFSKGFNSFFSNPILGIGFGAFSEVNLTTHKYPHNIYIELLAEGGLICFTLFCLILKNNSFKGMGQGVLFILICLSFSGDFSYFRYAFYPLLISTYIYNFNKKI